MGEPIAPAPTAFGTHVRWLQKGWQKTSRNLPIESTTFVPLPLLRALLTSLFKMEVEPLSQLIPEEEFGVANAARR